MTTIEPGTIVALRYRIRSPLGQGGMGVVYRAEHVALRREVALKLLRPELAGAEAARRFEREALAASRLDHPGCVRVLDHGRTVDGQLYLAMELLHGPTLVQVLRQGAPPRSRAIAIAGEVLAALGHAHARGVLHRDVKPENVVLTWQGGRPRAVLIDFGLARLRGDEALTAAGTCVGSPSYLAPERLLGRGYDARADVYAVGVMLYEMLAGVRPFAGATTREIVRGHLHAALTPPSHAAPGLPPALDAIVRTALARRPEDRFADAATMEAALAAVPAQAHAVARGARLDEATTTTLATLVPRTPAWPRRVLGWLRYGGWRWSSAGPSAG